MFDLFLKGVGIFAAERLFKKFRREKHLHMKDLTKGNPVRLILGFALPMLLGNIFQLLYNLADTRIVGQTIGELALGALGATSSINSVIVGFLNGLTNGFALIVARFFGAQEYRKMRDSVAATITLGFMTSAVLTFFSVFFLDGILNLLNTPTEIFPQAKAYIRIILAGMTISMMYNICAAVLRAIGDTLRPLIFLIVAALCNIGLDFLFISGFKMGVEGAAYATLISQGISVILCVIYIFKKYKLLIPKHRNFILRKNLVLDMYATGLSMGFMISIVNLGSLALQGSINRFGTTTIVSHTASRKISEMLMLPISVFGASGATYSSQNLGAGRIDRVKKGIISATALTWIWSAFAILLCYTLAPQITKLITDTSDPEIIKLTWNYMRINTPFYFVLGIVVVFRNSLQGIGDKLTPILSSIIELIGKVIVVLLLAPRIGYLGIMISEPLVWIFMTVPLAISFFANPTLRTNKIR